MLSIITAVHNQIEMNRLFFENIKKYTKGNWELIIIDNASTDGSGEFFKSMGARVVVNEVNFSYPVSQNQGIALAKGDYLAFLNNDIIVAPDWNQLLVDAMESHQLLVATCSGIENAGSPEASIRFRRKWNYVKNSLAWLGNGKSNLERMHRWMYGNWEVFSAKRQTDFGLQIVEGFVGNSIFMAKEAIEKIGLWDERIQAADFDLFVRTKKRSIEVGDIRPCHIVPAVFHHHFIRLTVRSSPPPFADAKNIIPFEQKYSKEELQKYLGDLGN